LRFGGDVLIGTPRPGYSPGNVHPRDLSRAAARLMSRVARYEWPGNVPVRGVDCEGAEHDIMRDQRTAGCIDQIAMEVHHVAGVDPQALRSLLMKLGSASLPYPRR
jgi:hypothetical protein